MTIDPKEMINGILNEAFELTQSFAREIVRMAFMPKEKNDE